MKNKLADLNNHLFAAIERLNDEDIKGDSLKEEISRAKAIAQISSEIVDNAKVQVDVAKLVSVTGTLTPYRDYLPEVRNVTSPARLIDNE